MVQSTGNNRAPQPYSRRVEAKSTSTATQKVDVSVDALFQQVRQFSDADLDTVLECDGSLGAGLKADKLTEADYAELLRLIDIVETHNARRVGYLAKLANLRETTLEFLIKFPEFRIYFNNSALL